MSANRLATLLGVLILFSLIVYLVFVLRRRQAAVNTRQARTPKVQPPYSPGSELNEISDAGTDAQMPRRDSSAAKPFSRPSPAVALTRPNIVSPAAGHDEQIKEEEDRERDEGQGHRPGQRCQDDRGHTRPGLLPWHAAPQSWPSEARSPAGSPWPAVRAGGSARRSRRAGGD